MEITRNKLFGATISIMAEKGYAATTVDDICAKAGVSKGAFFHHYPSKQSLTVAALNDWAQKCNELYAAASYHQHNDPLDRFLGYLDFRRDMLSAPMALASCPVGTMIQEVFESHPDILRACNECISRQIADVQSDIAAAISFYKLRSHWTAESLALHTHAVLQGMYILAKAKGNVQIAKESIDHLRAYIELLFPRSKASSLRNNKRQRSTSSTRPRPANDNRKGRPRESTIRAMRNPL